MMSARLTFCYHVSKRLKIKQDFSSECHIFNSSLQVWKCAFPLQFERFTTVAFNFPFAFCYRLSTTTPLEININDRSSMTTATYRCTFSLHFR